MRMDAHFFEELALGGHKMVFAFIEFAFGNGPMAFIFVLEEWTARMRNENFQLCVPKAIHQQPCADAFAGFFHTTSTGHLGMAFRNAWPYFLVSTRLSSTTTIPLSVLVRINRPTPWRNLRMASGNENSKKG